MEAARFERTVRTESSEIFAIYGGARRVGRVDLHYGRFEVMSMEGQPLLIPPQGSDQVHTDWLKTGDAMVGVIQGETPRFALHAYARMVDAFRANDAAGFNQAVADYRTALTTPGRQIVAGEQAIEILVDKDASARTPRQLRAQQRK